MARRHEYLSRHSTFLGVQRARATGTNRRNGRNEEYVNALRLHISELPGDAIHLIEAAPLCPIEFEGAAFFNISHARNPSDVRSLSGTMKVRFSDLSYAGLGVITGAECTWRGGGRRPWSHRDKRTARALVQDARLTCTCAAGAYEGHRRDCLACSQHFNRRREDLSSGSRMSGVVKDITPIK